MLERLYFDPIELRKGNFYEFPRHDLKTVEGNSFELENWIGRGGNATVYQCKERVTGEEFAIKFLLRTNLKNAKRFLREIKLLKLISDDHVTKYHGSGRVRAKLNKRGIKHNLPFVVMELANCNLQEKMYTERGALRYEQYAGQFRGLAKALALLHEHAVHRDIKPENILVVGERWLLSDYGLCSFIGIDAEDLTREGQNIGPKFWMSPEAHNHRLGNYDRIERYSDVFQLAAVFWYVATGRQPSGIVTKQDWTGPEKLFHILHRSLFHDFRKRPQDGTEFSLALEEALFH